MASMQTVFAAAQSAGKTVQIRTSSDVFQSYSGYNFNGPTNIVIGTIADAQADYLLLSTSTGLVGGAQGLLDNPQTASTTLLGN